MSTLITTNAEWGFRPGEWAVIEDVVLVRNRPCYQVKFGDGIVDQWVVADPDGKYIFREG